MTKARDLGKLVSQGQPLADGTVQASEISGLAAVATSGSYNDLLDKPTSAPGSFSGNYADLTNKPTFATVATSGSYADLTNKPTLFSGSYSDLTNKPTLFSGSYSDLTNKPTLFDGSYNTLTDKPTLFSGSYVDLTNKPTLFSGSYTDLTNTPTLFSGSYTDLTNKPNFATVATSGSYVDLNNKPTIDAGPSITSLAYSGNDQATDTTTPLPVTIIGTGFEPNSKVYIDTVSNGNSATALQFSGTTQITFTPPAKSAASYNVWVVTPTGKMAVLVNGILYSGTPSWAGVATTYTSFTAVSIQLTATSADTPLVYTLVSGTLPTGVTLSSSGLLSGTVTGLTADTNFPNIVIRADDPQNQDASITIQLSILLRQQISRSLRFNRADAATLTRTPASASNQKTWTWSGWIKRGRLGIDTWLFSTGTNPSNVTLIRFVSSDILRIYTYDISTSSSQYIDTTAVFRDSSAWYHIVGVHDTTQAITADRLKLYVNGVLQTGTTTGGVPQNSNGVVNSTSQHIFGPTSDYSAQLFDGYMAEVNFIDGQALTPTSFGETDPDTGVWRPKRYVGAYGTNGFYLNFSDNSNTSATTLGKDSSGNNNNWTPNNFSVTAGVGNDSVVDSPTSYGTDTGLGGEVRGNYATWSPVDKSSIFTLTNGNLDCAQSAGSGSVRGTIAVSSGKWYWEITVGTNNTAVGIALVSATLDNYIGGTVGTAGFNMTTGLALINSPFSNATGASIGGFTTNDIIGLALDFTAGTLKFYKNGTLITDNHITNVSGLLAPAIGSNEANSGYIANFGQRPFAYTAPSGFKALCTQNLPTPTIGATSTMLADDYFNTVLWTGNGASSRAITGVGFQPDWVWDKMRSNAYQHAIVDSVRGGNRVLHSNSTAAEDVNWQYGYVSSFNSDGFTIQAGSTSSENWNLNNETFVAWCWKANGAGSTNTAGSITSTVSANTTSGFSVVTYTGNGSASATVGHGLGVTPSMIICKSRSNTTAWYVKHTSLASNNNLLLAGTDAAYNVATGSGNGGLGNLTSSTTFGFLSGTSSADAVNLNGGTFVAYCFAEVPGFSAFGSYVGNGSADGPFILTGFRPAFIMFKRSSGGGNDWRILDSKRTPYNQGNQALYPNTSTTEASAANDAFDILSNGFKMRGTAQASNESGSTYIFAAFAETPFKYALAR